MKTALIIYWSKTGNTEKVANAIKQGLYDANIKVTISPKMQKQLITLTSIWFVSVVHRILGTP